MNNKTDISAAFVGSTGVDKLYLGNEVVWQSTPPGPTPYDQQYLTIEALEDGKLWMGSTLNTNSGITVEYSTDNGQTWSQMRVSKTYAAATKVQLNTGDKCLFRGDNPRYSTVTGGVPNIAYGVHIMFSTGGTDTATTSSKGTYIAYGNIMSLINSTGFTTTKDFSASHAFLGLFGTSNVVDASNLILPATGLTDYCYAFLFQNCKSLTKTPALPATTLAESCYRGMFGGCTSLTSAPALPATTLANYCYTSMFGSCTSLTSAPALPATTLANYCYNGMFGNCTSLTSAPALTATTLATGCYQAMFNSCTNLTAITCLATDISATNCLFNWVDRVAATGTFYKDPNTTSWSRGANGIPTGWTVQDYVDPATIPVLKIAGQSITGTRYGSGDYDWGNLTQYSGTSFTIEVGGVPITADTWDYGENYIDECGESSEISHDTGTTMSVFEVNSGYIGYVYYDPDNNSVSYVSDDDNTSDDPEVICGCQGGCWDGETCQECPQSCEDQGLCDDGEGNCVECEGELVNCSEEWENLGYSSEEECDCVENNMGCEDGDPCDDWEGNGYASYEECTCVEREENCDYCTDWETLGYVSLDDCNCQVLREGCNMCDDWENNGYSSYEECTCEKYGEGCPEEESGE